MVNKSPSDSYHENGAWTEYWFSSICLELSSSLLCIKYSLVSEDELPSRFAEDASHPVVFPINHSVCVSVCFIFLYFLMKISFYCDKIYIAKSTILSCTHNDINYTFSIVQLTPQYFQTFSSPQSKTLKPLSNISSLSPFPSKPLVTPNLLSVSMDFFHPGHFLQIEFYNVQSFMNGYFSVAQCFKGTSIL